MSGKHRYSLTVIKLLKKAVERMVLFMAFLKTCGIICLLLFLAWCVFNPVGWGVLFFLCMIGIPAVIIYTLVVSAKYSIDDYKEKKKRRNNVRRLRLLRHRITIRFGTILFDPMQETTSVNRKMIMITMM